ncbi:MAG: DUF262 domain-containing protein [Candidatus Methanoliparum thermophilum]|uniref:DUF262 domain-containing protein n=1 Tax=Methanoliparum thermophilum TaxID=2491083 RepID=A0A520KU98_METT2|nr:MAG: DUF262 domain-containing protein [Candidatus Methanoliparum thermophilum]
MNNIDAKLKSVREVLDKKKYFIDFFQREYKWERKQIEQLISDLTTKFFADHKETDDRKKVQNYPQYYLGPIIISSKEDGNSIIDGQQRLTSITLLLIYLNNLQKIRQDQDKVTTIPDLIFSERYGEKSFNLQVPERKECLEALYNGNGENYKAIEKDESVQNLMERYNDIQELFPEDLKGKALPYFIDWLVDNVVFVEVTTCSDDDAYIIFETMNDRGLNLTPTEMLKGYLLSNLSDNTQKQKLNVLWKKKIGELRAISKDEDLEFCKAWLRAKYAETIRPGREGAANEDFEKIGTRFHQWVRDNKNKVGLINEQSFRDFVEKNMSFFVDVYVEINKAANEFNKELENIFYINERRLAPSIFYPLLMAPITLQDNPETIKKKFSLVAMYLEMFTVFRSVNYKNYSQSSIRYTMYTLVKEIRNKDVNDLAQILKQKAEQIDQKLDGVKNLRMHGQNKRFIKFLLARITSHIEEKSGISNEFKKYINQPFQIEHIWADKFEDYRDEFEQKDEFENYRNKIGALLLLPEEFNQSYGALPYEQKLPHYFGQNLLAKTLTPRCYEHNPKFITYKEDSGLPFKTHEHFKKKDIDERQELYQKILEEIYNLKVFDEITQRGKNVPQT